MPSQGVTYLGVGEGGAKASVSLVLTGRSTAVASPASSVADQTAYTYTLPKNSLAINRFVRIRGFFTLAATAGSTRTVKLHFGGTTLCSVLVVTGGTVQHGVLDALVAIATTATQTVYTTTAVGGNGGLTPVFGLTVASENVLTSDIIIKMSTTTSTAVAGDVLSRGFLVEVLHEGSPE